ncbi:MAG: hypothetical protein WD066_08570 [Planctomycetaceae bacterium]
MLAHRWGLRFASTPATPRRFTPRSIEYPPLPWHGTATVPLSFFLHEISSRSWRPSVRFIRLNKRSQRGTAATETAFTTDRHGYLLSTLADERNSMVESRGKAGISMASRSCSSAPSAHSAVRNLRRLQPGLFESAEAAEVAERNRPQDPRFISAHQWNPWSRIRAERTDVERWRREQK